MAVSVSNRGGGRSTSRVRSKRDLTPNQARLLEMMQQKNFCRIENLHIRAGEPLFDPHPRVIREVKLGGENGSRPEAGIGDFSLKRQVQDLLVQLDRVGDGVIEVLVVKHGLPFSMQVIEHSEVDAA